MSNHPETTPRERLAAIIARQDAERGRPLTDKEKLENLAQALGKPADYFTQAAGISSISRSSPMELTEEVNPILRLNDLRARCLAGEELTSEEYQAVLQSIRRARSAAPAPKSRAGKSTSTPVDPGSLLEGF